MKHCPSCGKDYADNQAREICPACEVELMKSSATQQPTPKLDEVAEKCRIDIYNLHPMIGDNWKQVEALIKLAIQEYSAEILRELKYLISEIDGSVLGLLLHPEKEYDGFCISKKSKQKLQLIKEIIKHYERI